MPSIAEIILQGGKIQGEGALRAAAIESQRRNANAQTWGSTLNNVAQIVANIPQEIRREKLTQSELADAGQRRELTGLQIQGEKSNQAAQQTALEQGKALNQLLSQARVQDPETGIWKLDRNVLSQSLPPQMWAQASPLLDASDKAVAAARAAQTEAIKREAELTDATGNNPVVFAHRLNMLVDNHIVSENAAMPYLEAIKRDPSSVPKITGAILGKKPGEGQTTLNQGDKRIDAQGNLIAENPKPAEHSPIYKEWQDAASTGYKGTFEQYQNEDANRKKPVTTINMGQSALPIDASRPDPTTANKPDKVTGLTPNGLYQGALSFALSGTLPAGSRSMAAKPKYDAIQNKAAALAAAAGVDLPTLQQDYKSASASSRALTQRYQLLSASAQSANDNIDYARELSPTVQRGDIPAVNRFSQWVQRETGLGGQLPNLSQFELAIYTAAREYAKVTSGSAASIAELSTNAAKKVDELINAAQQPAQFQKVTEAMQRDMGNVTRPLLNTIQNINDVGPSLKTFLSFIGGTPKGGDNKSAKDPLGLGIIK